MESLNKIDLSGLKDRKIQFLCLTVFFALLSLLMLYHQRSLIFNHITNADTKAYGQVTKIIQKESLSYPVYTFKGHTHTSLIPNDKIKAHQHTIIYYNQDYPQTFYSQDEVNNIARTLRTRLIIIAGFILLTGLNFYLYKRTP